MMRSRSGGGSTLAAGILVLTLVDLFWVLSSELTEYIFKSEGFDKPFFATYMKNAMFSLYLIGFAVWSPWRQQCCGSSSSSSSSPPSAADAALYAPLGTESDSETSDTSIASNGFHSTGRRESLGEPLFIPMPRSDDDKSSEANSDAGAAGSYQQSADCVIKTREQQQQQHQQRRQVRFNRLMEVRNMPAREAFLAQMARLSFSASLRRNRLRQATRRRQRQLIDSLVSMPFRQMALLALQFSIPFFAGQYCYQLALSCSQPAYVNILSSTTALFTLLLAAVFPASSHSSGAGDRDSDDGGDRFTLTKLAITVVNIGALVCVSVADMPAGQFHMPVGALWAVAGSLFYAAYVVLLRAKLGSDEALNMPMFFGFVGVFVLCLLWPGLLLGHLVGYEPFQMPTTRQWLYLVINGLVGTVVSELFWIWGCLLTSSLIATLALSATVPLTMLADALLRGAVFSPLLYAGAAAVVACSALATLIAHWHNWDPLGVAVVGSCSWLLQFVRRRGRRQRQLVVDAGSSYTGTAGDVETPFCDSVSESNSSFSLDEYDVIEWGTFRDGNSTRDGNSATDGNSARDGNSATDGNLARDDGESEQLSLISESKT